MLFAPQKCVANLHDKLIKANPTWLSINTSVRRFGGKAGVPRSVENMGCRGPWKTWGAGVRGKQTP